MAEKYEPLIALDTFLSTMGGNSSPSIPCEIVIDLIQEAIRTQERILAMGPRSLEFAALDERETMLQAIATIRERKTALEQMLERVLKMEGEENCPVSEYTCESITAKSGKLVKI